MVGDHEAGGIIGDVRDELLTGHAQRQGTDKINVDALKTGLGTIAVFGFTNRMRVALCFRSMTSWTVRQLLQSFGSFLEVKLGSREAGTKTVDARMAEAVMPLEGRRGEVTSSQSNDGPSSWLAKQASGRGTESIRQQSTHLDGR